MKYKETLEKISKIIEELYWSSDYDRMSSCGQKELEKLRELLIKSTE